MGKVFVTGAGGFVGQALCKRLLEEKYAVRAAFRKPVCEASGGAYEVVVSPDLGSNSDWKEALEGVDVVIHLAARVHVMKDRVSDPLAAFREVNAAGTELLARQAASAGVKRFVFLSSIGVNGKETFGRAFTEAEPANPHSPYAQSKYEAECALWQVADQTGLEVVIVRAPLVYGPGNPGNMLSLMRLVAKRFPFPLSLVRNRRSLIYLGNLVDALLVTANHKSAPGNTFLVSDGEDASTRDLVQGLADGLGRRAIFFPVPLTLLMLAGKVTGKSAAIKQLSGSLQVGIDKIRKELGWHPPFTLAQGLQETADWFKRKV
jgi:nucleoside-diphosphate-sugar epimerase